MNLQQLRYVRAVAQEGSFVDAADRCAVTQPTLSNGIAQLEAEIGNKIFERTTRSVRLTSYGEQLLPAIMETLRSFDRLKKLAGLLTDETGFAVHIGISPVVGIHRAETFFAGFLERSPDTKVIYREDNLESLSEQLKTGKLDVVVAPLDPQALCSKDDYVALLLESEPLYFVPREDSGNRWADVGKVEVADICDETFVLVPDACGLTRTTKRVFQDVNLTLHRYPGEAMSYAVVEEWAALGLGSGILPVSKISLVRDGQPAIPIVNHDSSVLIEYYALGRPNTISPEVFGDLWGQLLKKANIVDQKYPASIPV